MTDVPEMERGVEQVSRKGKRILEEKSKPGADLRGNRESDLGSEKD